VRIEVVAWAWSGQCAWASVALHALGAWLTSSGFGAVGALLAASFAYRSAMKTIAANNEGQLQKIAADNESQRQKIVADNDSQRRKDELEAMTSAIAALAQAKQWVRQRNMALAETPRARSPIWTDEYLWTQWLNHPAASRYATLSIARARLELVGIPTEGFDAANKLIDEAHDLGLNRKPRELVGAKERAADKAIDEFATLLRSKRESKTA
jgi:hypothetical protein